MCVVFVYLCHVASQTLHLIIQVHLSCSAKMNGPFVSLIAFMCFSVSADIKALKSSWLSNLIFSRNVWELWKVCDNLKFSSFLLLCFWNVELHFFFPYSEKITLNISEERIIITDFQNVLFTSKCNIFTLNFFYTAVFSNG